MRTYFKQPCPVCGRPLYVPIELLGSDASCTHCSGVFAANGSDGDFPSGAAIHQVKQSETQGTGQRRQMSYRRVQRAGC